jgi:hypothetical protein
MKARVELDKRSDFDKRFDDMWNKLCRSAKLTPMQSTAVAKYLRDIMRMRLQELQSAFDMAWLISLIESEGFGTDVKRGAKRLLRVQQKCVDVRNEAFSHGCVDGNGVWGDYDGCGIEHLQNWLARYGVEYEV